MNQRTGRDVERNVRMVLNNIKVVLYHFFDLFEGIIWFKSVRDPMHRLRRVILWRRAVDNIQINFFHLGHAFEDQRSLHRTITDH